MNPELIRIGPLAVKWYGVLVMGGAVLAAYFASRGARRRGHDPEHVWDMLIWVLFLGIIGARLYHVFSSPAGGAIGWSYYREHPLEILHIWNGGLAIYGALIGGMIGVATYVWYRKLDLLEWFDIILPNVLLAQAIGRWGNFVNQEAYGAPTNLPWAIYIDPEHRIQGFELYDRFHPTFLYESIWCVLGWLLLGWISKRYATTLRKGDLTALYFIWYPTARFFVESLRIDAWRMGGMATAQWFSLASVALAMAFLTGRRLLNGTASSSRSG